MEELNCSDFAWKPSPPANHCAEVQSVLGFIAASPVSGRNDYGLTCIPNLHVNCNSSSVFKGKTIKTCCALEANLNRKFVTRFGVTNCKVYKKNLF